MKRNLTTKTIAKYKRIIDEWFNNGFNGKLAYMKFFPRITKDATATVAFSKIQALPELVYYIDVKHQAAAKIVNATHEGILKELQNWVQSDITETLLLTEVQIQQLPIEVKRLIAKYKINERKVYDRAGGVIEETKTIEVQFVSKERAIDMINKHIGFYEVDNKQKATQILISASNEDHKSIIEGIIEGGN